MGLFLRFLIFWEHSQLIRIKWKCGTVAWEWYEQFFFSRWEDRPVISEVFLSSSDLTMFKISSSVTGLSAMLKMGMGVLFSLGGGMFECECVCEDVGWILLAISAAMLAKKELKELAMSVGSVMSEFPTRSEWISLPVFCLLSAVLRIDQVFFRSLAFFSRAVEKCSFLHALRVVL